MEEAAETGGYLMVQRPSQVALVAGLIGLVLVFFLEELAASPVEVQARDAAAPLPPTPSSDHATRLNRIELN
jgi:hypothetical protein